MYDLIIVGGASSGLSAAIYAARKKLNFVVLTEKTGGQSLLTDKIDNYPGFEEIAGFELVRKMETHAKKYGTKILEGEEYEVLKIEKADKSFRVFTKNGEKMETKSVIVASGKRPRLLNAPGEKEFTGKGVTYCSICDAPIFQGKNVAVVGGGNAGFESAMDLLNYADKIYILEYEEKMRGDEFTYDKLAKSGKVEFIVNVKIAEIRGDKFVSALIYEDGVSGEKKELKVEGVFINVGQIPNTDFLKGFLELNEFNEIVVNGKTGETSVSGIFAAGDATDIPFKQCVIAAGQGAMSALSAHKYLQGLD